MSTKIGDNIPTKRTDFLFDEENDQLRRTVRQFLEREINHRANELEEAGIVPRELFLRGGELGFFGHGVPEDYGGYGADCRMSVVLAEELSHAHTSGVGMAFGAHTEIAIPHIVRFGTEEQKQKYLPELVAGRKVAALGITEPAAGSNVSGIQTRAKRDGADWVLNGSKIFITNAVNADVYCVAAKTDTSAGHRGISMFLVERKSPGFDVHELKGKLGRRGSDTGELTFDDCRIPGDALLGEENRGLYQTNSGAEDERTVNPSR